MSIKDLFKKREFLSWEEYYNRITAIEMLCFLSKEAGRGLTK